MLTRAQIDSMFTYHPPSNEQIPRYDVIRSKAKELALAILAVTPPCADQTASIRRLREAVMTANAAIALEGKV